METGFIKQCHPILIPPIIDSHSSKMLLDSYIYI